MFLVNPPSGHYGPPPPIGEARMTKGRVGLGASKTAGHFPRLVKKGIYLNTDSLLRNLPNFGIGRPKRGAEQRDK